MDCGLHPGARLSTEDIHLEAPKRRNEPELMIVSANWQLCVILHVRKPRLSISSHLVLHFGGLEEMNQGCINPVNAGPPEEVLGVRWPFALVVELLQYIRRSWNSLVLNMMGGNGKDVSISAAK
jgi:hypothetical protein